MGGARLRATRL